MIYHAFSFFNEFDVLEVKLGTENFVDKFYIIEANQTHSGLPKPFYLEQEWDRFAPWHNKIEYIKLDMNKMSEYPHLVTRKMTPLWERESFQRDYIKECLKAENDDIVIVSDLDEILDETTFNESLKLINQKGVVRINQPHFVYRFNGRTGHTTSCIRVMKGDYYNNHSPTVLIDSPHVGPAAYGGFHFSFIAKDNKGIYQKFKSFSHADEKTSLKEEDALDHLREHIPYTVVDLTAMPQYLQDNQEKFRDFLIL